MKKSFTLLFTAFLLALSWVIIQKKTTQTSQLQAAISVQTPLEVGGEPTQEKELVNETTPEATVTSFACDFNEKKPQTAPFHASDPATLQEIESYEGNLLWGEDYGVEGEGMVIGLWEAGGLPDTNLIGAFGSPSRISYVVGPQTGSNIEHANNVARRLIGNGPTDSEKGIARKAMIEAYRPETSTASQVEVDLKNRLADGSAPLMLVSNHSYRPAVGYDYLRKNPLWRGVVSVSDTVAFRYGRYGFRDKEFDDIVYQNPRHTLVLATGNDRSVGYDYSVPLTVFNGPPSFNILTLNPDTDPIPISPDFDCIPNGNLGKNVITVGAVAISPGGYDPASPPATNASSSIGPTDDGRIKPDLVAPSSQNSSGAAPQVSGSALLLQELNWKNKGQYLLASTIKALFIHTAFQMTADPGPSYEFGWGAIQPKEAADFVISTTSNKQIIEADLPDGESLRYYLYLDGAFKATMAWTDPPIDETPLSYVPTDLNKDYITLVNDLDMRLRPIADYAASGEQPWVLDKNSPANPAAKGDNTRDNIEQIATNALAAGWYELEINHKGVLLNNAPQQLALILEGAQNGNCLVTARPAPEQTYSGGSWSVGPVTDKHTYIRESLTLSPSVTAIKDLIVDPNVTVTIDHDITLSGNIIAGENEQFIGNGTLTLSGSAKQIFCGCTADSIVMDNANGIELRGNPTVIQEGATLASGTIITNGLLTLRGKQGVAENRYAQLTEAGGTTTGEIQYETWIEGGDGWRHLALPVKTTVKGFFKNFTFFTLNPAGPSIFTWDASTASWVTPTLYDTLEAGTPITAFFGSSNGTTFTPLPFLLSVTGTPHTGSIVNSLEYGAAFLDPNEPPTQTIQQRTGWNFIGNPYPQNLNWKGIAENIVGGDVVNAYHVWNGTTYQSRAGASTSNDGTGDAPLTIAPMKGFFVKAESSAASSTTFFNFSNTTRTSVRGAFSKKASEQLKVLATAENETQDAFFIAFNDAATATTGFDPQHDAYKLMSPLSDAVQIFQTQNIAANIPSLAVQVLPAGAPNYTIPVTVKAAQGTEVTVEMDVTNWPEKEWVFFLEDLTSNEVYELNEKYRFNQILNEQHFLLHLYKSRQDAPTALGDNETHAWFNAANDLIILVDPNSTPSAVRIMNINGQVLYQNTNVQTNNLIISAQTFNGNNQYLLIEIITESDVQYKRLHRP